MVLLRRELGGPYGRVRSGMAAAIANWAMRKVDKLPDSQLRAWRPHILVPIETPVLVRESFRLLYGLTRDTGSVTLLGLETRGTPEELERELEELGDQFDNAGVFVNDLALSSDDFVEGVTRSMETLKVLTFRPNMLYLAIGREEEDAPLIEEKRESTLQRVMREAAANGFSVALFAAHEVVGLGDEETINVWIVPRSPDWEISGQLESMNILLLVAYTLQDDWDANVNVLTSVVNAEEVERAEQFLENVVELARLRDVEIRVIHGTYDERLEKAPEADLNIFSLQTVPRLAFVREKVRQTSTPCVFVQDSGEESAAM
jgi:hypothetical protein